MKKEELEEILNSYKWIKVKRFDSTITKSEYCEYEQLYEDLLKHHEKETEFLIKKCRELAKELLGQEDDNTPGKIIKVYNKKDAPKGAIFLSERVERNGIVDISVRSLGVPKTNEKVVYLYQIPKK